MTAAAKSFKIVNMSCARIPALTDKALIAETRNTQIIAISFGRYAGITESASCTAASVSCGVEKK